MSTSHDSVSIRLVDVELRAAVQALSQYMDRPVVFSGAAGTRVTLDSPRPVATADIPRLLRGLLETQSIDLVADSAAGIYRLRVRDPNRPNVGPQVASTPAPRGQGQELFVIHLRHAKASEVAATVNALYGKASAFGEIGDRSAPPLSRDLTMQQTPPIGTTPSPGTPTARSATLNGEVTIVPDVRINSLLIRASRADFALIQAAVTELDTRPLQVLVEVLIAEVRRDRGLSFGVGLNVPKQTIAGTQNTTIQASTTGAGLSDFVVKVMGIGGNELEATISAAASRGDATIISRPVLLAANNEKAEINVGSQRPFVQVSRVLPTDNAARDQVVQYKDVGTRLAVTPTISADGYVMLQVVQEINAATAEEAFDAPVISTRSVETRLLVKDRQTVVLGGITDHQREHSQSGIAFLSSLPWIGGLFGRVSNQRADTELFVFLTPRIIATDADADAVTTPREEWVRKVDHE
jgi:general secretion pathway protein D